MNKSLLLLLLLLPTLLFSQGTPRAGGINNVIAPVIFSVHDNFVGVQHSNSNSFAVFDFTTNFNYQLGLNTTDNIAEGSVNKYFTNTLARNAFSAGFGLDYSAGIYSLNSTTQGILSSVSNKFNNPSGLTTEYVRGDGSIITFPTIPTNTNQLTNGAGFITSVPAQSWSSITGKPTITTQYGDTYTKEYNGYIDTSTSTAVFNISSASFSTINSIYVTTELIGGVITNIPLGSITAKSTTSVTVTLVDSKTTGVLIGGTIEGLELHTVAGTRVYITVKGN